jgi:hypothetical protein
MMGRIKLANREISTEKAGERMGAHWNAKIDTLASPWLPGGGGTATVVEECTWTAKLSKTTKFGRIASGGHMWGQITTSKYCPPLWIANMTE